MEREETTTNFSNNFSFVKDQQSKFVKRRNNRGTKQYTTNNTIGKNQKSHRELCREIIQKYNIIRVLFQLRAISSDYLLKIADKGVSKIIPCKQYCANISIRNKELKKKKKRKTEETFAHQKFRNKSGTISWERSRSIKNPQIVEKRFRKMTFSNVFPNGATPTKQK